MLDFSQSNHWTAHLAYPQNVQSAWLKRCNGCTFGISKDLLPLNLTGFYRLAPLREHDFNLHTVPTGHSMHVSIGITFGAPVVMRVLAIKEWPGFYRAQVADLKCKERFRYGPVRLFAQGFSFMASIASDAVPT